MPPFGPVWKGEGADRGAYKRRNKGGGPGGATSRVAHRKDVHVSQVRASHVPDKAGEREGRTTCRPVRADSHVGRR